jgi:hypothetical protein
VVLCVQKAPTTIASLACLFVSERHHGIVACGAQRWIDCADRGAKER